MQSLAVKYRPKTFDDVVGQSATVEILKNQLRSGETKQAYLFIGSAGCGKTTCARIFANELNHGVGGPIELDAASNNSVDDIRELTKQARTKSLTGEYKVFILDELHMLSGGAWAAMLKLIEEPPEKTVFIGCTTNPEKIPKTILSRCQRFDFRRMKTDDIIARLKYILHQENFTDYKEAAVDFIAKQANGGMRDAITLMYKALSYSNKLTVENVSKALGVASYDVYQNLFNSIYWFDGGNILEIIEEIYEAGIDLKQFIDDFLVFVVDLKKWWLLNSYDYISIPKSFDIEEYINSFGEDINAFNPDFIIENLLNIKAQIKYSDNPKYYIEAALLVGSK